jgi:hypothetical protein
MDSENSFRPVWRDSAEICALADEERHLGHILRVGGRWHAFDATHFNEESNGFRRLGSFASKSAAKEAVERSGRQAALPRAACVAGAFAPGAWTVLGTLRV